MHQQQILTMNTHLSIQDFPFSDIYTGKPRDVLSLTQTPIFYNKKTPVVKLPKCVFGGLHCVLSHDQYLSNLRVRLHLTNAQGVVTDEHMAFVSWIREMSALLKIDTLGDYKLVKGIPTISLSFRIESTKEQVDVVKEDRNFSIFTHIIPLLPKQPIRRIVKETQVRYHVSSTIVDGEDNQISNFETKASYKQWIGKEVDCVVSLPNVWRKGDMSNCKMMLNSARFISKQEPIEEKVANQELLN